MRDSLVKMQITYQCCCHCYSSHMAHSRAARKPIKKKLVVQVEERGEKSTVETGFRAASVVLSRINI